MKYLDPSLGVKLPERAYGNDCRIYTPNDPKSMFRNVRDTFFDEFVPMHIFGWYFGTLMVFSFNSIFFFVKILICW